MKVAIAFLSLIITASVYGQADFTGSWKLNKEKSDFDRVDPSTAAAAKLVLKQNSVAIIIQRNENAKQNLKIDSTAETEVTTTTGHKTKVSIRPTSDKEGLIEARVYVYAEGQSGAESKKTRTWTLSGDKKILIIQERVELTDGQTVDMTLIYDRQ
jgi:hypothetical protein